MKVILDAFGGDNAPLEAIEGALIATEKDKDIEVILCGDENKINEILNGRGERISIFDCKEVIEGDDDPIWAVKNKKNSSVIEGLNLLKEGKGNVFISAGNTGAVFTAANLIVKRIKGVKRSGLGMFLPSDKGPKLLFDIGANVTLSPEYLNQLAIMGSAYYENVVGGNNPSVGLINIGTEETKGTDTLVSAYKLMSENTLINFKGNCEARDLLKGDFDVMICEGFTGNIMIKTLEGTAKALMTGIKNAFMKNTLSKICALGVKGGVYEFKKKFDYKEYGAAPVIGLRMPVMKAHGSSDRKAFANAVLNSKAYVNSGVIEKIAAKMNTLSGDEE